jgi:hypothetical protein
VTGLGTSLAAPLRPVDLAEVLATAALQDRVDRKYLVRAGTAQALLEALAADHRVLSVQGRTAQAYSTVYLDSADLACHRAHLQGRRRRWKARTRRYLGSDLTRLELKTKGLRGRTVKRAVDVPVAAHGLADAAAHAFVDEGLRAAYGTGLRLVLEPVLEVRYVRTTVVADAGGERLTLDTDLEVRTPSGVLVGAMAADAVLLESKAGARPGRSDRVLRALGVREASCSKYCVGTALSRPDLPAAPWRPLLQSWFAVARPADLGLAA